MDGGKGGECAVGAGVEPLLSPTDSGMISRRYGVVSSTRTLAYDLKRK